MKKKIFLPRATTAMISYKTCFQINQTYKFDVVIRYYKFQYYGIIGINYFHIFIHRNLFLN